MRRWWRRKRAREADWVARRSEREIDEELRFHVEGRVEALMAEGMEEGEARTLATSAFGDMARIRDEMLRAERARDLRERRRDRARGVGTDVRHGVRRLLRTPVLSISAVVTLALGIGATVAMFTVMDAVMLRPLPYPDPDRLVRVWPERNMNIALSREVAGAMPSVAAFTGIARWGLTLTGEGVAATVLAEVVDAGFFDVFGAQPLLGRAFTLEETEPARSAVVILSHGFWQRRFGADPGAVGRRIRLDGYVHDVREVIGVMPSGFRGMAAQPDVWVPLQLAPGRSVGADSSWYVSELVARVAAGVPMERVSAEARAAAERARAASPSLFTEEEVRDAGAVRLLDGLVGNVRRTLWLLLGAVGLVLLIACVNIANLQMARAERRRRDLAVRLALGANAGRIVREQLVESGILALAGGVAGVVLARMLLAFLRVTEASGLPRMTDIALDARALACALVVTAMCVVLFGLFPAFQAASMAPGEGLRAGTRAGPATRRSHRVGRGLVAIEVALSVLLVTGAGLVLSSFAVLRSIDPGMDASDVLAVRVVPSPRAYDGERAVELYRDLSQRIGAMPGVRAVGAIQLEPFAEGNWSYPYLAEGVAQSANAPLPHSNFRVVTPGYFDAVDVPLLAGRGLTDADRDGAERVMVLNAAMAREIWPDAEAVGRTIRLFGSMPFRVVGVVGDVRQHRLEQVPRAEMYVAHAQWDLASMSVLIEADHHSALASGVRAVVNVIDPDIPIADIRSLDEIVEASLARRRFFVAVLASFGVLALVLAGVGVYGVTSHRVGSTLRDAGVRLALGATPASVLRGLMISALGPAAIGFAVGLAGAFAASGLLHGLLFGIPRLHLPTWLAAALVLGSVSVLATWLPSRRAARLDPLTVLRAD